MGVKIASVDSRSKVGKISAEERYRPVPSSSTLRYPIGFTVGLVCCGIGKETMSSFSTTLILPIPNPFMGLSRIVNSTLSPTCWDTKIIGIHAVNSCNWNASFRTGVTARDRSKNRKPLQKGRYLSIEAIQTVQVLKRTKSSTKMLEQGSLTCFSRLLKLDMIAVLRELLRQNECYLALKVFEEIRKEYWYKPRISYYVEIISVLGSNGLVQEVEILFDKLKFEDGLEPDLDGFNALLESLTKFNLTSLALECLFLMKSLGCDPNKSSFKILISYLQENGEVSLLPGLLKEAKDYYGCLDFLDEEEETRRMSSG